MILSEKDISRFWGKVSVSASTHCWEWTAGKTKFGHGVFSIKHKWVAAHRVSFFIKNKYLPERGRVVMHDCENPACQNPNHLLDGTVKENGNYPGHKEKQRNKVGSWKGKFGSEHKARWGKKHSPASKALMTMSAHARKLEEHHVVEILRSKESSHFVAQHYGVSPRLVRLIRQRKRWKHIQIKLVPRHESLLVFRKPEAI